MLNSDVIRNDYKRYDIQHIYIYIYRLYIKIYLRCIRVCIAYLKEQRITKIFIEKLDQV